MKAWRLPKLFVWDLEPMPSMDRKWKCMEVRQLHCLVTLSTLGHVQTEAAEGMELARQKWAFVRNTRAKHENTSFYSYSFSHEMSWERDMSWDMPWWSISHFCSTHTMRSSRSSCPLGSNRLQLLQSTNTAWHNETLESLESWSHVNVMFCFIWSILKHFLFCQQLKHGAILIGPVC